MELSQKVQSALYFLMLLFCSLFTSLYRSELYAYPTFIGVGYTNCMTCHYNPHGHGQLNDYGKALFASEIAAKPFWNPNVSDDELGQHSGFFFNEPQPRMIRPSFKFRELYLNAEPGSSNSYKRYVMQGDLGVALHFDEADKYIVVMSAGYINKPLNADIKEGSWNYHLVSREHYLRTQLNDEQFLSVGLMDIAYGIRHVDHTAANRRSIGLDQNSQVHGVLYNYFTEKIIFGLHGFVGNQLRDEIARIQGVSSTFEYVFREKMTIGASILSGETKVQKSTLYGIHSRMGVGQGSSIMTEAGFNKTEPKTGDSTTGAYGILIGTLKLMRGLDLESTLDFTKSDLKEASTESYRYGIGLIYFPFQRAELRVLAQDTRSLSPTEVKGDSWVMQTQWHWSM